MAGHAFQSGHSANSSHSDTSQKHHLPERHRRRKVEQRGARLEHGSFSSLSFSLSLALWRASGLVLLFCRSFPKKKNVVAAPQDGILDIQFKEETSSISFSTMHIGHLAVIHPRSSNLPITEWSLKPKELGVILFEMEAGQFSVKIQITQKGCRLLQPDRPELSRILNRPMGARYLLANMARCNLDLNFRDGDAKAAELECRDRGIEKELHLDLSQVSSGFEVSSSHWNRARSATECLFKIREASEGATTNGPSVGEDTGNDWWSVGCNKDTGTRRGVKYSLLDLKEDALEFHAKNMQGEITHATLRNCLSDEKCSATALAVVANSDIMVQSHVRNLLDAIRPFSFA